MNAESSIRAAGAGDLARLLDWLTVAGLPTDDLTEEHMAQFLVLDRDEEAVGMIGLEPLGEMALLRSLVVDKAARGAGAGRKLVNALENLARDRGIVELWLLTIDADAWFSQLGYARRSRDEAPDTVRSTREFAGLCPDDAVLMSKTL